MLRSAIKSKAPGNDRGCLDFAAFLAEGGLYKVVTLQSYHVQVWCATRLSPGACQFLNRPSPPSKTRTAAAGPERVAAGDGASPDITVPRARPKDRQLKPALQGEARPRALGSPCPAGVRAASQSRGLGWNHQGPVKPVGWRKYKSTLKSSRRHPDKPELPAQEQNSWGSPSPPEIGAPLGAGGVT